MSVTLYGDGLSPWSTVLRMATAADRLRALADVAERRGHIADATRAVLAESRVLHQLLDLGMRGSDEAVFAKDAEALQRAVGVLVREDPDSGDRLAQLLRERGRNTLSHAVAELADRTRQHQVSENKELSHA